MERIKIAQIFADQERFGGKEVLVSGWARTISRGAAREHSR